jgi:hypothetical protein
MPRSQNNDSATLERIHDVTAYPLKYSIITGSPSVDLY